MEDRLIWVDENDRETGSGNKLYTHEIAQLHRAFSVFIFDQDRTHMLLQQRAAGKYHSGGLWSNACCSHPRQGEEITEAIRDRLRFELGFHLQEGAEDELVYCGSFRYRADFETLSEHELDHVYYLIIDADRVKIDACNPEEIQALKWVGISELEEWLQENPEEFSAWFAPAYDLVKGAGGGE